MCRPCRAYVGVHPHTDLPLGTLADEATREARKEGKSWFQRLVRREQGERGVVYQWLAEQMNIRPEQCHWAMFDEALANEAEMEAEEAAAETEQAVDEATTEMAEGANELEQDMERPMLTAPAVEREGYANATADEVAALTAEDLEGSYVYGANDETVGEIGALVMGDNGEVGQVVINVGGFLGIGEKPVAVTWDELQIMKNAEGDDFRIYIDSSEEALEAQPEYQG